MRNDKKYKLVNPCNFYGKTLHRIMALRDFFDVKSGSLGGWVESELNLNQSGFCWIYDEAKVFDNAIVYGDAVVRNEATVKGSGFIHGRCKILESATIGGDSVVGGRAVIRGNAFIGGDAIINGNATVSDHAIVYNHAVVTDNAIIHDHAVIACLAKITSNTIVGGNSVVFLNNFDDLSLLIKDTVNNRIFKRYYSLSRDDAKKHQILMMNSDRYKFGGIFDKCL